MNFFWPLDFIHSYFHIIHLFLLSYSFLILLPHQGQWAGCGCWEDLKVFVPFHLPCCCHQNFRLFTTIPRQGWQPLPLLWSLPVPGCDPSGIKYPPAALFQTQHQISCESKKLLQWLHWEGGKRTKCQSSPGKCTWRAQLYSQQNLPIIASNTITDTNYWESKGGAGTCWGRRTLGCSLLLFPPQNSPGWRHEATPAAGLPWEAAERMLQAWLRLFIWINTSSSSLGDGLKEQLSSWWGAWADGFCIQFPVRRPACK